MELKIELEKTLDACANEGGGANFLGELIMYYKTPAIAKRYEFHANVKIRKVSIGERCFLHFISYDIFLYLALPKNYKQSKSKKKTMIG